MGEPIMKIIRLSDAIYIANHCTEKTALELKNAATVLYAHKLTDLAATCERAVYAQRYIKQRQLSAPRSLGYRTSSIR